MNQENNPFHLERVCQLIKANLAKKAHVQAEKNEKLQKITNTIRAEYYKIIQKSVMEQLVNERHVNIIFDGDKPHKIAYVYVGEVKDASPEYISDASIYAGVEAGHSVYTKRFIPSIVREVIRQIEHELMAAGYEHRSYRSKSYYDVQHYAIPARLLA